MRFWILACGLLMYMGAASAGLLMKPVLDPDLRYQGQLLTGSYDPRITPPSKLLGFEIGERMATPDQIVAAINTWANESDRLKVVEYARTHEGRPLLAVFISQPQQLAQLAQTKAKIAQLADPLNTSDKEAAALIEALPAVAWMAYSIHGNETSGADGALAAIYHLVASQDAEVTTMLDNMLVVIDPMMNPDGRARFAQSLEQFRGTAPNVDDQSLLHRGDWPYARTNHYFFDLNRDFFYLTQPETRGRVALINQWRPQLMIDGHEMGSQDTFLMGPPRQPLNANIHPSLQRWAKVFAQDQATAFDQRGWRYYTGEWFENWYPGYSNYAEYRGTMHILYEQSRMAEDGVRRPEGTVQTYQESVHHQLVSTLANLSTLHKNSQAMYQDYWNGRKRNLDPKGPFAKRSFVILANDNLSRTHALVDKLLAQGIEVMVADADIKVSSATKHTGETIKNAVIPKGSVIIPNRQAEAPLIAAILEFDASIKPEVLQEERQKVLRDGSSLMYDTTAWNLTMMYGLDAWTVPEELQKNISPYTAAPVQPQALNKQAIAWAVNGEDDASVTFAARLMERHVQVRVSNIAAQFDQHQLPRGSVMVTVTDNPSRSDLVDVIQQTAQEANLSVMSITSGFGKDDLPEWGGRHFPLLKRPQIALLSHGNVSSYDVGVTWWSLDTYLGIRHSQLDVNSLQRSDLRRYNVIVMPHGSVNLSDAQKQTLKAWVAQGGTLIAHDGSSKALAAKEGLGSVRLLSDVVDKAESYDIRLQREWLSLQPLASAQQVMQHTLPTEVAYPWKDDPKPLKKEELEKRVQWQKRFMPSGAIVAGRTDQQHWLTFGTPAQLPLLVADQPLLMVDDSAEAVVRVGVYAATNEKPSARVGWYSLPEGQTLSVRMSGLLWPEAAQGIANTAYLTRERQGRGQIILFAGQPNFRGAARGTNRLLLNALVYGPGLGTSALVNL